MRKLLRHISLLTTAFMLANLQGFATHNRAGEITFKQVAKLTFEVTLVTYTDSRSVQADRPEVEIKWGDGATSTISRNSQIAFGGNTFTYKNVYIARHTYPAGGKYIIQFLDPNRIEGINNIGNSVNVPFYVESELVIDPARGFNESPLLLQPPIDYACPNKIFVHNPNAFDPDGDSLYFSLIPPKRDVGEDVPDYSHPPATGFFTLDPFTGELIWDAPPKQGIYNIAILIEEYRNGIKIGYVIRDMQIIVQACTNNPPVIAPLRDTCIEAGTSIELKFMVNASDPDSDIVTMTATGGPFLQATSPAVFLPNPTVGQTQVQAEFKWTADCKHIRKAPYKVVFRAVDDDSKVPLSDLEQIDITVVGPAPNPLTGAAKGNAIEINWKKPGCANVVGYVVYRKEDSSKWNRAYCETGVPSYTGFYYLDTIPDAEQLTYKDNGLSPGITYCYRVTALYINEGNYELAEGYASDEVCSKLKKDVPVLTHASVRVTSEKNGSVYVDWSSPTELDTLQNPGPYEYELMRNGSVIATFTGATMSAMTDTVYIDTMVNTTAQQRYSISFYNMLDGDKNLIGRTGTASTVYLQSVNRHQKIELYWSYGAPWRNYEYVVYKKNDTTQEWDSIATVKGTGYTDTGLVNGKTYCYKVKSIGTFNASGFQDPIINFSQEYCSSPRDTIPPCKPTEGTEATFEAEAFCEIPQAILQWQVSSAKCAADVAGYNIYYSPLRKDSFVKVGSVDSRSITTYTDMREALKPSMAGCYYITAVDTYGNESEPSKSVCVDNCPLYELPNVFTPNGDGHNDLFTPLNGYRFVQDINIIIYNRWGQEVFTATETEINWDGSLNKNDQPLPDGVYYYICTVNMIYLDGNKTEERRGMIHLLR